MKTQPVRALHKCSKEQDPINLLHLLVMAVLHILLTYIVTGSDLLPYSWRMAVRLWFLNSHDVMAKLPFAR